MTIGVFDSGIGGKSVANAISRALPDLRIIVREDREHLPYGTKSPEELLELVIPIFHEMIDSGCQIIVVACNTVSTTIINELRKEFIIPLIALDPMIKPAAALTRSGVIAVCATPATLASNRFHYLKKEYAGKIRVLEPDCSDWAMMIENNELNHDIIDTRISSVIKQDADVIVLACTHYHWIENEIVKIAGKRAKVLQPEQAIVERLKTVLEQRT